MFLRLAAVVVVLGLSVNCSEPPNKERHQAEGALAAARAAEAATYAADELKAAESALEKYDAAVAQRDYRQALSLAVDARDTAYDAVKHAGDEKAAARSTAERLIARADETIRAVSNRFTGPVPMRPAGAAADRLRTSLSAATSALQEARSRVGTADYRGAAALLTPVLAQLERDFDASLVGPGRRGR